MATNSKIEWTDATWNPVLGCDKISHGCKNCYAIRTAYRLQHNPNPKVKAAFDGLTVMTGAGPNWTGRVNFVEDRLEEPIRWRSPRMIFVNSQSDLFHDEIANADIALIFAAMLAAPQHTYQVLTKRPKRMHDFMNRWKPADCYTEAQQIDSTRRANNPSRIAAQLRLMDYLKTFPATWEECNRIWLGVSCENQQAADERVPLLLQTPAAVRWVSAEPLLSALNLRGVLMQGKDPGQCECGHGHGFTRCSNYGGVAMKCSECDCMQFRRKDFAINWVVCGGESGPGARPMEEEWARSLMEQCKSAGVPFFMKQGAKANWPDFKSFDSFPADLQVREYPK